MIKLFSFTSNFDMYKQNTRQCMPHVFELSTWVLILLKNNSFLFLRRNFVTSDVKRKLTFNESDEIEEFDWSSENKSENEEKKTALKSIIN